MGPINRDSTGSEVPLVPFSDDQRGKYVLHEEGEGHYSITLDGRIVKDTHKYSTSLVRGLSEYGGTGLIRIALVLDWTYDPGRRPGCFDARPEGLYVPYLERSFDEIKAEFDQYRQEWESSQAKVELQDHMAYIIKHNNDLTDVVSFGTGSFQNVHIGARRRSCLQIAALLTMTGCINEGRTTKDCVRCFSQEPEYTSLDKEFLRSIGVEPIDDPDGFFSIGSNSVVCEWATYDCIIRKISERPWPAVLIAGANRLERVSCCRQQDGNVGDSLSFDLNAIEARRVHDMLENREQLPLSSLTYLFDPDLDSRKWDNRGWQPSIYWRKGSVTGSEEPEILRDAATGYAV